MLEVWPAGCDIGKSSYFLTQPQCFCLPLSCRACGRRRGALPLFLLMDRLYLWNIHYVASCLYMRHSICVMSRSICVMSRRAGGLLGVAAEVLLLLPLM